MRITLLLLAAILLSACSYKMDIRQGNYITQEQRERLRLGMSRIQVRALLGTPLVADPFHPDRWDYAYSLEHRKKLEASQRMTLYFEGDKLARIDDANMPPMPVQAPAGGVQPPAAPEGAKP